MSDASSRKPSEAAPDVDFHEPPYGMTPAEWGRDWLARHKDATPEAIEAASVIGSLIWQVKFQAHELRKLDVLISFVRGFTANE